jgi:hypothetical protein
MAEAHCLRGDEDRNRDGYIQEFVAYVNEPSHGFTRKIRSGNRERPPESYWELRGRVELDHTRVRGGNSRRMRGIRLSVPLLRTPEN